MLHKAQAEREEGAGGQASEEAARLIEDATAAAERIVQEARAEAETITLNATANAERMQAEAERIVEAARAQAETTTANATADAERMVEAARAEAQTITHNATAEAERIVEAARAQAGGGGAGAGRGQRASVTILFQGELAAATQGFAAACRVGGGGFGSVYMASGLAGMGAGAAVSHYAVKKLDVASMQGQTEFLQEVLLLGACHREHLLPVYTHKRIRT